MNNDHDLNLAITRAAFEGGTGLNNQTYWELKNMWFEKLVQRGLRRPPVENTVTRNGIELRLQQIDGDNYRYVPVEKFDADKLVLRPRPVGEILQSEIRIGLKALKEAQLVEAGAMEPEEGEGDIDTDYS